MTCRRAFRRIAPRAAAAVVALAALVASGTTVAEQQDVRRVALDEEPPPPGRSAAPTAEEWLGAGPVKLSRTSPRSAACVATRVREWLRVRCPAPTFAISLLAGSSEGLSFWIGGEAEGRFGEVQLPLRRGDRRVVQLWATADDRHGSAVVTPALVLQEVWLEGEAAPTVTVL